MTLNEAEAMLRILERHDSPGSAITQLRVGEMLGIEGGADHVRRVVQHLRDRLLSEGHCIVCHGGGMFLDRHREHVGRYFDQVGARSISGAEKVVRLQPHRAEELIGKFAKRVRQAARGQEPQGALFDSIA